MKIMSFGLSSPERLLLDCAEVYCHIWREPPWREDCWTIQNVVEKIRRQMAIPGARGFLAIEDNAVIGFTWGFNTDKEDMRRISEGQNLDFLFRDGEAVFYLAELGVRRNFRKHKTGEKLTSALLLSLGRSDVRQAVLRTNVLASAARNLYAKVGFKDLLIKDSQHEDRTYWVLSLT